MVKFIIIAAIAFMVVIGIIVISEMNSEKKRNKIYYEALEEIHDKKTVVESLEAIARLFKPKSIEYAVINKALFYLNHSIMMDYETAFNIVEKVFDTPEIAQLHNQILANEENKIVFLLEKM